MTQRAPRSAVATGTAVRLLLAAGCGQRLDTGARSTLLQNALSRGGADIGVGTCDKPYYFAH